MKRPNRKEYINKATKVQLIADLERYIDYLEAQNQALTIPVVSQRSELLVDFWMNLPNTNKNKGVAKHYVDEYLKSTNCG